MQRYYQSNKQALQNCCKAGGRKGDGSICALERNPQLVDSNQKGTDRTVPFVPLFEDFVAGEFEEEGFLAYVEEFYAGFGVITGALD